MADENVKLEVEFDENSMASSSAKAQAAVDDAAGKAADSFAQRAAAGIAAYAEKYKAGKALKAAKAYDADPTIKHEAMQAKIALAGLRDPKEKLKLLKDEFQAAPLGSTAYAKGKLAFTQEEVRQEKTDERETAADTRRQQAWENRQLAQQRREDARQKAKEDREAKAAERTAAREEAAGLKAAAKVADAQEKDNAKQWEATKKRNVAAFAADVKAKEKTDADLAKKQAGAVVQAKREKEQQAYGRAAAFAGAANLAGGLLGNAASGIGSAVTGDVSGVFKSAFAGVQTVGSALQSLGPYGLAAGSALNLVAGAASTVTDALDGLVANLGQYSASVSMEEAKLDVATTALQVRLAGATEGLMTEWIQLKEDFVSLLVDFEPEIRQLAEGIREVLAVIRTATGFFRGPENAGTRGAAVGAVTGGAGILPGGGILGTLLGIGKAAGAGVGSDGKRTPPESDETLVRRMNALTIGATQLPTAPGVAPQYQAPGGGGVSFSHHVENHYSVRDEMAVDRIVETTRDELRERLAEFVARLGVVGNFASAQTSLAFAG